MLKRIAKKIANAVALAIAFGVVVLAVAMMWQGGRWVLLENE